MTFADATTGGYIAGNIIAGALVVLSIAALVLGVRKRRGTRDRYDRGDALILIVPGAVVLVCTVVGWFWSTWPFAYEYHHWVDKKVTVAAMSSRLLTDGDGNINQK